MRNLDVIQSAQSGPSCKLCQTCKLKETGFFCHLNPTATKDLDSIKYSTTYPGGAVLFIEKQSLRGVYVLCSGKIKLSISSSGGRRLTLRIAKPGEVVGLMAAMSGSPYEVTAETLEPCHVEFIRQDDFLHFIGKYPEVYQAMLRQLSSQYFGTCEQIRTIGLSGSSREKLARLLLHWSHEGKETKEGTQIRVPLTHEQIAEFVGSTRETITRTLSEFKSQHLVMLKGMTIMIPDLAALQAIGGD
jgi:CRP/FNR family transcriptional regulator, cyclic AMP receptor protein